MIGQYVQGNQPDQQATYFYDWSGQPWKTQAVVRKILAELYGSDQKTFPGVCAIAFNYPLIAFVGEPMQVPNSAALPVEQCFLRLDPPNLILTALKKSEDGNQVVLRFYEAEGYLSDARIELPRAIRSAWRTSLIEENQESLAPNADGSLSLKIQPWEITTLKLAV
jgi:alpha-mannosidase